MIISRRFSPIASSPMTYCARTRPAGGSQARRAADRSVMSGANVNGPAPARCTRWRPPPRNPVVRPVHKRLVADRVQFTRVLPGWSRTELITSRATGDLAAGQPCRTWPVRPLTFTAVTIRSLSSSAWLPVTSSTTGRPPAAGSDSQHAGVIDPQAGLAAGVLTRWPCRHSPGPAWPAGP